jgi:hypothetical protein
MCDWSSSSGSSTSSEVRARRMEVKRVLRVEMAEEEVKEEK